MKAFGKITLTAVIFAAILKLSGCAEYRDETLVWEGELDKKYVQIYQSALYIKGVIDAKSYGTRIVFLKENGGIDHVLFDYSSGVLGDEESGTELDYIEDYSEYAEGIKCTLRSYTNEEGKEINFKSAVGKKLEAVCLAKFEKYAPEFDSVLDKLPELIDGKL